MLILVCIEGLDTLGFGEVYCMDHLRSNGKANEFNNIRNRKNGLIAYKTAFQPDEHGTPDSEAGLRSGRDSRHGWRATRLRACPCSSVQMIPAIQ